MSYNSGAGQHSRGLTLAAILSVLLLLLAACSREPVATGSIEVSGQVGERPQVSLELPITITDDETTIVVDGDGHQLTSGDAALIRYLAYDAENGDVIEDSFIAPPTLIGMTPDDAGPMFEVLDGINEGSRLVRYERGTVADPRPKVIIVDVFHTRAVGEELSLPDDVPQVTRDEDGTPSVDIPEGSLADLANLRAVPVIRGSGTQIRVGDAVTVRFMALDGATGEVTESSWGPGAVPTTIPFTGLIPGWQNGLVDASVGSQMLLLVPSEQAYGTGTVVFVVDILAVTSGGEE